MGRVWPGGGIMYETKQRVNKPALEKVCRHRTMKQVELAKKLNVSVKSFNRWVNEGYVPSQHVLDISEVLELTDEELHEVFLVPTYRVYFRRRFLGEVSEEVQKQAVELAKTLFALIYLDANTKFYPPNVSTINDPIEVADQIRKYVGIESFDNLQGMISILTKQGVEVAIIPFKQLELNVDEQYEQAFSVSNGSRCVIFLDADSPEKRLIFNLCHELCHLFRPDPSFSKTEEKFCNDVAAELVYPKSFFDSHKKSIQTAINQRSIESIISLINLIKDKLGGEIFGIALRLKSLGYLSQKNPVHKKVISYAEDSFSNLEHLSQKYFF